MAEILRLQTNVPETIALKYPEGKPTQSQYGGDQIMFSLTDGRITFLPPFAAKKISDAGIGANEDFLICKREKANGNRRMVEYEIDLAPKAAPGPVAVPANGHFHASGAARQLTSDERAGLGLQRVPQPTHQDAPVRGLAGAAPPLRPNDLSAVEFMKLAGRGAIDSVVEVEQYARSKGMTDFIFGPDDIQKIWVSLYIDLRKGGRA